MRSTSSASPGDTSSFPFDLLGLSAELRLIVYDFAMDDLDISSLVLDTRSLGSFSPSDKLLDAIPELSDLFPSTRFDAQVREEVSDIVYKRAEFLVTLDGYQSNFTNKGRRFGAGAKKAIPGACDVERIVNLCVGVNLHHGGVALDTLRTIKWTLKWTQLPAMHSLGSIRLFITITIPDDDDDSSSEDEDELTSRLTAQLSECPKGTAAYRKMMRSFVSNLLGTDAEVQFGLREVEKARLELYTSTWDTCIVSGTFLKRTFDEVKELL